MPQMAPSLWTLLMLMFSMSLLMITIIIFFDKENKIVKNNNIIKNKLNMNWKW
uniref:ATP synthase F0 subunit 8 n=1 Tax=Halticus minutus TaxID=2917254 RepID=UPI001F142F4F|nr:ATP synthase F0 subunit 8 [Halticus minutus]UKT60744.1 ATP synthase F0 subunit 8 [Halticus minutus]